MPDLTQRMPTLKVSVRKLVEFSCRRGDLLHEGIAGPTAQQGQIAHKQLQAVRGADESAEVKVSADITTGGSVLQISGRVDLLGGQKQNPAIGEIKSCYAPVDKIPQCNRDMHWAQLKIYGYCVLADKQCTARQVSLRLIWFNINTNETTVEAAVYTQAELTDYTHAAAHRYIDWMTVVRSQQEKIANSAATLTFPHAQYRQGQREMAAGVYVSTRDKGTMLCEAPTGIGKTISTLFPAAKAIGERLIDSVIYLTAKTSGRQSANQALQQLASHGLFVSSITITAKKTTCHCTNGTCERNDNGRCPLTIGFFDRLPEARRALIGGGIISPQDIDNAARAYQLCPFELTLQMLPWVSVVICDYNYIFDPLVRLNHFTERSRRRLLLVDEAHNLTDRASSMYSAKLNTHQLKEAAKESTVQSPFLAKAFKRLTGSIERYAKKSEETAFSACKPVMAITRSVRHCVDALTTTVENQLPLTETQADAAKALYRYLVIEDLFGDHHRVITTTHNAKTSHGQNGHGQNGHGQNSNRKQTRNKSTGHVIHQLQCLNATGMLHTSFKPFRAAVTFSATLRPQHFYRQSLGLNDNTACISLPSPFDPTQQGTYICNWINTRYHAREHAINPIVDLVYTTCQAKPGNYQVYFPSYSFMEAVYREFIRRFPDVPTMVQQRGSSDNDRAAYLGAFESAQRTVGFAILGGIYGEGIDYVGDRLIGTIIVGTGLASPSLQQQLIEENYTQRGLNAFDYGSRYPGFTRVLQTAGRVIRSESDTGIVILADQRFSDRFYRPLYPQHWKVTTCKTLTDLHQSLNEFWADNFSLSV